MDFRLFQALASDKREITAASPPFLIPSISITSGEGLSNWSKAVTSDHTVLISTALAERSGLKLGDTITVQCSYDAGGYPDVSLKIVGIYEVTMDNGQFNTTSTDKRNRLIIDHKTMQEIMMYDVIQYDNGVEFLWTTPGTLVKSRLRYRS